MKPEEPSYILPFLDPKYDPNHPIHKLPPIEEDPYAPLGKRQRKRLEREALEKALAEYSPPHVIRSWEVDYRRAERRNELLSLHLTDTEAQDERMPSLLETSQAKFDERTNPHDSSYVRNLAQQVDFNDPQESDNFRAFAVRYLHLGYHRFHLSTNPAEETPDPTDTPPGEICWIMEYSTHECAVIRRQIARILGIYPAATDETTSAYDYVIEGLYQRRLHARCRRMNRHCIRPSHIELFIPSGEKLP